MNGWLNMTQRFISDDFLYFVMINVHVHGAEPSGSAITDFIIYISLWETGCEDGRWMELAQDRVQWRALVLAVLNLRVLLPES
jgi:hypothetical protein